MVHLVCGHTQGSQVAVWGKGAGEEEDGGDTDVPPCLSLHPRRTVANGEELGLCFPLILGDTWGSGKHGEAGGGMSCMDRVPLVHPDTETREWGELGWGGAGTVPGGGWGGLSPRKTILNLSLFSISLHH